MERNKKALIALAKEGDKDAFGELYTLYFTPVFRYILYRVRNKEEAEDLVQTVFLKIFQSGGTYTDTGVPPLAYCYTVARNTVIDHWRKKKDFSLEELEKEPVANDDPHEYAMAEEKKAWAERAVGVLEGEQQDVIILRFLNEMSTKEIASMLGKSEAAVRQVQCRALKVLRKHIQHYE